MLQSSFLQSLLFDGCSSSQDDFTTPEAHIGGREVRQTLVIPVISVVLEQDAILQRLMPSLYLALRHRVIRRAAHVFHLMGFHPLGQFGHDAARAVVWQKSRSGSDGGAIKPRGVECLLKRLGHILGLHRGAQPSRDDVTRVVIENGREIEPTPARDLEVGEVGVPIKSYALQFRDRVLTSQALQHYTNLLFG